MNLFGDIHCPPAGGEPPPWEYMLATLAVFLFLGGIVLFGG